MTRPMPRLVTLGETMGALTTIVPGPLTNGALLRLGTAGAESTVAIGVRRLGHHTAWIGCVGDDAIGRLVLACLRGEDVDVTAARTLATAPTALMLRERRTADRTRVGYYRRAMAGSRLAPVDLDESLIAAADVLHLTGITPALSSTSAAAAHRALDIAEKHGVTVSFDVNYRSALWSRAQASRELQELAARSHLVFAGTDEAELLTGAPADPARSARAIAALGPGEVVIKLGADGAMTHRDGRDHHQPALPVTCVDPVGAGDAFVAGYLAAVLDAAPIPQRLHQAATCAAFGISVPGDWDGLPRADELTLLSDDDIIR